MQNYSSRGSLWHYMTKQTIVSCRTPQALTETSIIDQDHRSLQPRPKMGESLRPIIVKFHYFKENLTFFPKPQEWG